MKAMQAVLAAALVCWQVQVSDWWKHPLALTLAEEDCCVLAGLPSQGAALAELQQTARQCLQLICQRQVFLQDTRRRCPFSTRKAYYVKVAYEHSMPVLVAQGVNLCLQ